MGKEPPSQTLLGDTSLVTLEVSHEPDRIMGEGQWLRGMVDVVSVDDCSGALVLKGEGEDAVLAGICYGEERICLFKKYLFI